MKNNSNIGIQTISGVLHNFEFFGLAFCVFGSVLNLVVLSANKGKMPVVTDKKIVSFIHENANEKSRFLVLSDWIKIKIESRSFWKRILAGVVCIPIGRKIIISPGDIFIFISRTILFVCFLGGLLISLINR